MTDETKTKQPTPRPSSSASPLPTGLIPGDVPPWIVRRIGPVLTFIATALAVLGVVWGALGDKFETKAHAQETVSAQQQALLTAKAECEAKLAAAVGSNREELYRVREWLAKLDERSQQQQESTRQLQDMTRLIAAKLGVQPPSASTAVIIPSVPPGSRPEPSAVVPP